ncbi:uncharacterized protein LOC144990236 [Oryzias latipes]
MHVHFSVEYPIKQDILRTNFYFDNISTSERSVIRAPPPHSPGNPRMNPQEGARLKNSWTAGRQQDHGEGLLCIEDGGGNVTWSPQRILEMGDVEQTSSPFRPVAGTSGSQKSWSRRDQNDTSRTNQNDPEKNTEGLCLSIRKTRISCHQHMAAQSH